MQLDLSTQQSQRLAMQEFENALAQALLAEGLLSSEGLEQALRQQVVLGGHLATNLWELRLVDGKRLSEISAQIAGVTMADPKALADTGAEVRRLFTKEFVEISRVLPIALAGSVLKVATAEPWDHLMLSRAAAYAGYPVEPHFIAEVPLIALLDKVYSIPTSARFWLGVQSNTRRGKAHEEVEQKSESGNQNVLANFVHASVAKVQRARQRPKGLQQNQPPLLIQPMPAELLAETKIPELVPIKNFAEAVLALESAATRDEVGEVLLRFALSRGRRALLLVRRRDLWAGWLGGGHALAIAPHTVRSLLVPTEAGTVFGLVAQTGAYYLGPLAEHPTHDSVLQTLGGGQPRSVTFLPVHVGGRIVFGIYLDGGRGSFVSTNVAELLLLAQRVPQTLERLVRQATALKTVPR